jgi:hypothetical protein
MTSWSDIVTTALLGTGRRPVPTELPSWADAIGLTDPGDAEHRLLDLAAAHGVAAKAGRVPQTSGTVSVGATAVPRQRLTVAPPAARRMLDTFFSRPDATAINVWLVACVRHGCGLAPEHWAPLAGLAARSTTYDRAAVAAALGERGRWFVHQNPEWQRLAKPLDDAAKALEDAAKALDEAATALDAAATRPEPVEGPIAAVPATEQVEADPESLVSVADPWPDALVGAALAGLVSGRMGNQTRSYARRFGRRLTEAQYAGLGGTAQRFLELPRLSPASRRAVRSLFVEIERAAYEVIEIDLAFDPPSARGRVFRVSIPPV